MAALIEAVIGGLLIGCVYALISIGLTLVFGIMDMVNFAHAEFMMLGMFGAYAAWAIFGIDPLVSAVVVGFGVFLVGLLVERVVFEPIIKAPAFAQVMATIGISLIFANGAAVAAGTDFRSVTTSYQMGTVGLAGMHFGLTYVYAALYAVVVVGLLALFLNKTEFGKAMRATAQNRSAAILMGINPRKMYMMAFGIGVGLAGLAGAVILPYTLVFPTAGSQYILIMFTVVVLGRLGSVIGAAVAGLGVGVIQSLTTFLLSAQVQNLVVFAVFFVALVLGTGSVQRGIRKVRRRIAHV